MWFWAILSFLVNTPDLANTPAWVHFSHFVISTSYTFWCGAPSRCSRSTCQSCPSRRRRSSAPSRLLTGPCIPGLRVVVDSICASSSSKPGWSGVVACLRAGGSPNASVSFTFWHQSLMPSRGARLVPPPGFGSGTTAIINPDDKGSSGPWCCKAAHPSIEPSGFAMWKPDCLPSKFQ